MVFLGDLLHIDNEAGVTPKHAHVLTDVGDSYANIARDSATLTVRRLIEMAARECDQLQLMMVPRQP